MTEKEWKRRFMIEMARLTGDKACHRWLVESAQVSWEVKQEEGDDDMTPEEWAFEEVTCF